MITVVSDLFDKHCTELCRIISPVGCHDMNPIENMWDYIKQGGNRNGRYTRNIRNLRKQLMIEWLQKEASSIHRLIHSTPRYISIVIREKNGPMKY